MTGAGSNVSTDIRGCSTSILNSVPSLRLRTLGGWEYIGIYCALREILRHAPEQEIGWESLPAVALGLGLDTDYLRGFVQTAVHVGAVLCEEQSLFCPDIKAEESERAESKKRRRAAAVKAARIRHLNARAIAERIAEQSQNESQSNRRANAEQTQNCPDLLENPELFGGTEDVLKKERKYQRKKEPKIDIDIDLGIGEEEELKEELIIDPIAPPSRPPPIRRAERILLTDAEMTSLEELAGREGVSLAEEIQRASDWLLSHNRKWASCAAGMRNWVRKAGAMRREAERRGVGRGRTTTFQRNKQMLLDEGVI